MKYTLTYQKITVGTIEQNAADFPNLWGTYQLDLNAVNLVPMLKAFIDYSVRAYELMETDQELWVKSIEEEEWKYQDIIDSEEWELIDDQKQLHGILVPNFQTHNEIVWRWS